MIRTETLGKTGQVPFGSKGGDMGKGACPLPIVLCIILFSGTALALQDSLFPIPDNLKDNVEFWKKIYVEVSLKKGLLHDRDYPLIIYDTLEIGERWGKELDRYLEQPKKSIADAIRNVRSADTLRWGNIEKRIAALFSYCPDLLDSAEHRIRFQLGQRERFWAGLKRSGAYLDTIRAILREHAVPLELAFLPHVESSFDLEAYSKAGAAGIWQFMPATGKEYLKIDKLFDQRRDPIISTHAAAKLLAKNYRHLKSWPLAITAYNYGLSGVVRAVNNTGSSDIGIIVQKHESPIFRFASKNFYSCFIAAIQIAQDAEGHFPELVFDKPLLYRDILLAQDLSVATIRSILGISEEQFRTLNPGIRPEAFKENTSLPDGTPIRLWAHLTDGYLEKRVAFYYDSIPPEKAGYYYVKETDDIESIAARFSITGDELRLYNHLESQGIRPGQMLAVPNRGTAQRIPLQIVLRITWPLRQDVLFAAEPRISSELENLGEQIQASALGAEDDSVSAVAKKRGTEPEIAERNNVFDEQAYEFGVHLLSGKGIASITVIANETIGHYAKWLNISSKQILRINKISKRSGIHAGQNLLIPLNQEQLHHFLQARLAYHRSLEESFFAKYRIAEIKTRILQQGESIWNLCSGNQSIPIWLLKKFNKELNFEKLLPGTHLQFPVVIPL